MYQYQKDAQGFGYRALQKFGYFLLAMTMRARKTRTVLGIIQGYGSKSNIVVCPPKVIDVWKKEIEAVGMDLDDFAIVSSSMLSRKEIVSPCTFLIIDEIHNFRDNSKRSKSILATAKKAQYVIGMTGTLFDKDELELYRPLKILGKGVERGLVFSNEVRWRDRWGECENPYAKFPSYNLKPSKKSSFYDELKKFCFIHNPGKVKQPDLVSYRYDLLDIQKKLIEVVKNRVDLRYRGDIVYARKGPSDVNNTVYQICSGFIYEDDKVLKVDTLKWRALRDLVDGITGEDKDVKFLLWYRYTQERNMLLKMFPNVGVFPDDVGFSPRFLVCHPRSAGAGVDLSEYGVGIYCGMSPEFVNMKQSEFRIAGQDGVEKKNYVLVSSAELRAFNSWRKKEKSYNEFYVKGDFYGTQVHLGESGKE